VGISRIYGLFRFPLSSEGMPSAAGITFRKKQNHLIIKIKGTKMKHLLILSAVLILGFSVIVSAQDKPKEEKTVETKTYSVDGMTCQGCVSSVESKLGKIDGVQKYEVDLEKGEAIVEYDTEKVKSDDIEKEFEGTSYKVTEKEKGTAPDKQKK